ncbi:olfactory receptor 52N5-like [Tachysurus fulvidraco]|uniref:olfactory receptor 52N5-like n=1 Tax=Tachysurus fulvidraco TaxID=1234273 RepID=UPI000F5064A3|nr:olfactory receptor 52N5-like [Tachysurus fulvidraco]
MENGSYRYEILKIDGLRITRYSAYPVFVLLLLIYVFIMVSNLGIVMKIAMEKALHKPMYLLFCNLPVCDALSASAVLPGLLKDILTESDRYISYVACVIQAFGAHLSSTSSHTILMIMAFDRYVAICDPLRYHTIMTNRMVGMLSVIAWVPAIIMVIILLSLTIRLSHCTSTISNPYCDNPSLFKLSCENVLPNQIFGLLSSVLLLVMSVSCIALTYIKIAYVCFKNQSSTMKSKAIKTCSTHLIVYLIFLVCGCTILILHRFTSHEVLRNLASILYHIVPTSLNPVIYGLQTTEIRQGLKQIFQRRKVIPR